MKSLRVSADTTGATVSCKYNTIDALNSESLLDSKVMSALKKNKEVIKKRNKLT